MPHIQFLPLLLAPLAIAETVQDLWLFPTAPDYHSNITTGSTTKIRWQPQLEEVFSAYCSDCNTTNVDLWMTSTNVYRKLEAGINVKTTFSYNWTVDLSASDVNSSSAWTLRFLPSDVAWIGSSGQEVSSPKFNILAATTSASASTSTSTSTSTSAAPTTTTTTTSTFVPASTRGPSSSSGLSTGAQAGIGVGVAAGAVIIIGLAIFLWRRPSSIIPSHKTTDPNTAANFGPAPAYHSVSPAAPTDGSYAPRGPAKQNSASPFGAPVSELPGSDTQELDAGFADRQRQRPPPPAELGI
ncbi:hypothetical protein ARAM_007114 [Aspergillus rambellii]|uniref:Mid2 domain-containing protein n=1 Tax=Aspergillus rambellii TaxID=308745 RepID=A0A0F8X9Z3_9EURO|nr:hypothetical protein ARAM_007114 [Aspergillus rambellii]